MTRMLILDVNVLVAAHRDDHPEHEPMIGWLQRTVRADSGFGIPRAVWASVLRVTTSRRVFQVPSPIDAVFGFIDAVLAQPGHRAAEPGPRHLTLLRRVCEEADARGDLVPDAVLAAIAIEHGAAVASLDRDFARFPVEHVRPG
jgi:toxin-antitoxin system PIN domain toxin